MNSHPLTRRHMLSGVSACFTAPILTSEQLPDESTFPKNASEMFQRLQHGNRRFAVGKTRHTSTEGTPACRSGAGNEVP